MSLEDLPETLSYVLGLNMDYNEIIRLRTIRRFYRLIKNPLFWQWKAEKDFGVSEEEFKKILAELPSHSDHEAYIRIAGENGYPIPGTIKYGRYSNLLLAALKIEDYDYVLKNLKPGVPLDDEFYVELGRKGNAKIIAQLPYRNELLIKGAVEQRIFDQILEFSRNIDIYIYILDYPAKIGDYEMIKFIAHHFVVHETVFIHAMTAAARSGNLKMIYFLEKYIPINYDYILVAAAEGSQFEILNLAEKNGATFWTYAFLGAVDYVTN